MAYSIEYTGSFKRDFKRLKKRGLPLEALREAIELLVESGSLPPEFNPHKLSGRYTGKWECHINGYNSDWLLVWEQDDTAFTLLMLRTGTHSDIF